MALLRAFGRRRGNPGANGWLGVRGLVSVLCLCFTHGGGLAAQSAPTPEYRLKAVFLFNFAQFVEWPASAFPEPDTLPYDPSSPHPGITALVSGKCLSRVVVSLLS